MSIIPSDLPLLAAAPSRRRFLQVSGFTAATAMLAVACSSDSDSASTETGSGGDSSSEKLTDVTVQMSWLCDAEFSPVYIADTNGYFADEGVKVEMIPGGPDIGAIEAIVGAGGADIGVATDIFSIIAANADGSDFVAVGALYQSNLNGFISPQDAPIDTVDKLAGKKIGGAQGVQPKLDAIFALNDMEPDYTFVPAGFGPDLVINGDVDTQTVFITDEVIAYREETGEEPVMMTWEEIGLPSYTLVFFTTKEYLENNRDTVKGFLKAIQAGQVDNVADPELGAQLAVDTYGKDAGLDLENEKKKNIEYLKYADSAATEANGYLYIDPEYVTSDIIPGMEAAQFETVPVEEAVDVTLLEEIKAEG